MMKGSDECLTRRYFCSSFIFKSRGYLSFTLRQGSIDSSFAATFATQPSVTLFRYIIGVLPINYINFSISQRLATARLPRSGKKGKIKGATSKKSNNKIIIKKNHQMTIDIHCKNYGLIQFSDSNFQF